MELILSGGWLGKEGLWKAEVSEPLLLERIEDIPLDRNIFLICSYDLAGDTLELSIKERGLPGIIAFPLKGLSPFRGSGGPFRIAPLGMSLDRYGFTRRVLDVKGYIERGDVYQINLTSEILFSLEGDPLSLFLDFFGRQPVPYAFFLRFGEILVLSGSMELFLRKEGDLIVSRPIKGTGSTPEEIMSKEKEKAENLMITDMVRNDLSRVAEVGTVRVVDLFRVERFSTLCQMHSTVVAKTDRPLPEILKSTFPPASVTGAPKRRAVELIDLLEPHARGYYCGTAGIYLKGGDFTLSVLIRTAYGTGDTLSYFAGCGIVWDSDPEGEFRELIMKVRAFFPDTEALYHAGPVEVCKRPA